MGCFGSKNYPNFRTIQQSFSLNLIILINSNRTFAAQELRHQLILPSDASFIFSVDFSLRSEPQKRRMTFSNAVSVTSTSFRLEEAATKQLTLHWREKIMGLGPCLTLHGRLTVQRTPKGHSEKIRQQTITIRCIFKKNLKFPQGLFSFFREQLEIK